MAQLLICFINKKKKLDELLSTLITNGAGGATVIPSLGVGRSMLDSVILYSGIKDLLRSAEHNHYTVLCVVDKKNMKKLTPALKKIYKNFTETKMGFFFTLPIDNILGLKN